MHPTGSLRFAPGAHGREPKAQVQHRLSSSAPPPPLPPLQYTRKGNNASDGQALLAFARGLAGGAPGVPRSKYLFDAVNLPQVGGRRDLSGVGWGGVRRPLCKYAQPGPAHAPGHALAHASACSSSSPRGLGTCVGGLCHDSACTTACPSPLPGHQPHGGADAGAQPGPLHQERGWPVGGCAWRCVCRLAAAAAMPLGGIGWEPPPPTPHPNPPQPPTHTHTRTHIVPTKLSCSNCTRIVPLAAPPVVLHLPRPRQRPVEHAPLGLGVRWAATHQSK